MINTKIEWATHTFNPWRGCTKVSEACTNCYAERQAKRAPEVLGIWGNSGTRVLASIDAWADIKRINHHIEAARRNGINLASLRIFCASMADVFEDWPGSIVDHHGKQMWFCMSCRQWFNMHPLECDHCKNNFIWPLTMKEVRNRLFDLISSTPHLIWLLLTKRPENVNRMIKDKWIELPEHCWIGTTVENQHAVDERIPELLDVRAAHRFLSCEPLLEPVSLERWYLQPHAVNVAGEVLVRSIEWVIVGGESGPNARPMHPAWARSLLGECAAAGVPFFFKQWGEYCPEGQSPATLVEELYHYEIGATTVTERYPFKVIDYDGTILSNDSTAGEAMYRVGKKQAGSELDGVNWKQFPEVMTARWALSGELVQVERPH